MSISPISGGTPPRGMGDKTQMLQDLNDLKTNTQNLKKSFASDQDIVELNDAIQKLFQDINKLLQDLQTFKNVMNLGDQKLLSKAIDKFKDVRRDIENPVSKVGDFENILDTLHANIQQYPS